MQYSVVKEHIRLLHASTTSCILAFAMIGSASAPSFSIDKLVVILLYLFLVGGITANYFDEICGRPWHTTMPLSHLWTIGSITLGISSMIGMYIAIKWAPWFSLFIIVWEFITVTYSLELFGGFFHTTPVLGLSWGLICLGSYYLQTLEITPYIAILSLLMSCVAGVGRDLYEKAKPISKDNAPPNEVSSRAWLLLRALIIFIDLFAILVVANRLYRTRMIQV